MFTIFPVRESFESDIGYFLRLVNRHGIQQVDHLAPNQEVARILKGVPSKNKALAFIQTKLAAYRSNFCTLFREPLLLTPKVCPECLHDDGIHRHSWLNVLEAQCVIHNSMLIDTCNECGNKLIWEPYLLYAKCTHHSCGKPLNRTEASHLLSEQEVADCLLAEHLINENSNLYVKPSKYPVINNYQETIRNGWEFLNRITLVKDWLKRQELSFQKSPLEWRMVKRSLLLANLNQNWPSVLPLKSFATNENRMTDEQSPLSNYIVKVQTACNLLMVSLSELSDLMGQNIINTVNNSRLNTSSLIDLTALIHYLASANPPSQHQAVISQCKHILAYYDVGIKDVLLGAKVGKLNLGYRPNNSIIDSLYCDEDSLLKFCKSHFKNINDDIVEVERALRLINAPYEVLMQMRRKGKFRPPRCNRSGSDEFVVFEDVLAAREYFRHQNEFDF